MVHLSFTSAYSSSTCFFFYVFSSCYNSFSPATPLSSFTLSFPRSNPFFNPLFLSYTSIYSRNMLLLPVFMSFLLHSTLRLLILHLFLYLFYPPLFLLLSMPLLLFLVLLIPHLFLLLLLSTLLFYSSTLLFSSTAPPICGKQREATARSHPW